MGLSSSTKKTKESGFRTESGTTTPVLPQPLQTGLTGLIDKTNQLAGEDPYGLVAGASGLQGQAFQAASTDLGGWQAPMQPIDRAQASIGGPSRLIASFSPATIRKWTALAPLG